MITEALREAFPYFVYLVDLQVTEDKLVTCLANADRAKYPNGVTYALSWDEREHNLRVVYLTRSALTVLLEEWQSESCGRRLAQYRRMEEV
jgi:hypothetical protein